MNETIYGRLPILVTRDVQFYAGARTHVIIDVLTFTTVSNIYIRLFSTSIYSTRGAIRKIRDRFRGNEIFKLRAYTPKSAINVKNVTWYVLAKSCERKSIYEQLGF